MPRGHPSPSCAKNRSPFPRPASPSRREQLWQQHVPTGMMTLGLILCPSPGLHGHPGIPAEDRAGGISRHDGGEVTDPAALLGVSQRPEPAPDHPARQASARCCPSPHHTGSGGMSGAAMLHLAGDIPACETPRHRLAGRRIWQEEAPASHKSRCHSRRAPAVKPRLRMDGLRAIQPRCSPFSSALGGPAGFPLAGNFNSATFISPLPSRDVGGTG